MMLGEEVMRAITAWVLFATLLTASLDAQASLDEKPSKDPKPRPANRLARETSPYLLLHAHNPVDWFPWGPEAFEKAKKENKIIFLSIGYSSCYWCHVMERQSFDDPAIAKLMNDHFVCIKVDREERPDVDSIYMTALHAQGSRGGWPLSMFLTPEGKPIGGGTYWPPDDKEMQGEKVRGFKTILTLVQDDWTNNKDALLKHADKLADAVNQSLALASRKILFVKLDKELVQEAVNTLKDGYDEKHGGFGSKEREFRGPKFPSPPGPELLLLHHLQTKDEASRRMVLYTLDRMAMGGIYDHLGGGFHRYSTDREWKIPHFEKMLYDNALLVSLYSRAFTLTKKPSYRRVIEESLAFIQREMTSPEGGFYSALDAESEAEEGKYYVWTAAEIDALLPKTEAELLKRVYGIEAGPNFEEKFNALLLPKPLEAVAVELQTSEEELLARLKPARQKLLEARGKRTRPLLDTKILTGWNGLMIAGYADAAMALAKPEYAKAGERAAEYVLKNLRTKDGRLLRTIGGGLPGSADRSPSVGVAKVNAFLEDYAFLIHGLLSLHDASNNSRWLDEALALHDKMTELFQDKEGGAFFFTSHDHERLFARAKDQHDGATPSGNSVAAMNLVRLARKTGQARYREQAESVFRSFAATLKNNPETMATLVGALAMWHEDTPKSSDGKTPAAANEATQKDEQVKVTARLSAEMGKETVTVTLEIAKGWHLYANPAGNDMLIPTSIQVNAKAKLDDLKIAYPKGTEIKDPAVDQKVFVYEGKVELKASFHRTEAGPLEVVVKYQACDDKRCLAPKTVKLQVGAK
jgi:uncharacterized protein YyaL (SSP411 family)